jgi:hypothetical protein
MPRYYFHLRGSGAADLDGQEFPDDVSAIAEAKQVAQELARNNMAESHERIVVRNENGETIHEEPLST